MLLGEYKDSRAIMFGNPNDYVLKKSIGLDAIAARAKFIRDQFTNTNTFPQSAVVALKRLALEEVNSTECSSLDLGCYILRSVEEIPRPVDVKDTVNFKFVGSVDGFSEWGWIDIIELSRIKYRKFSSKDIFYTWLDDRIYVFNDLTVKEFTIRYVPADLIAVEKIKNCDGQSCVSLDESIVIEDHWIDAIDKLIFPKYMSNKPIPDQQIQIDEVNKSK